MLRKVFLVLGNRKVQALILLANALFGAAGVFLFFDNYRISQNLLVTQVQNRELILGRAASRATEFYLRGIRGQLVRLSRDPNVASLDVGRMRPILSGFVDRSSPPVSGALRYDQNGTLLTIANRQRVNSGENGSFSNLEFLLWSKNNQSRGKVFTSYPYRADVGAERGDVILVLATPTYSADNHYTGTLAVRFILDDFQQAFVNDLMAKEDTAYIVDSRGVEVSGSNGLVDQNLITYAQKTNWPGATGFINNFKRAIKQSETKTAWVFQSPTGERREFVVASNKIDVPSTDRDLYLITSTPKDDIVKPLLPLSYYGSAWLGLGVLITFFWGALLLIARSQSTGQ